MSPKLSGRCWCCSSEVSSLFSSDWVTIDVACDVFDSSLLSELVAVSISTCSLLPELDWCPLLSSFLSKLSLVGVIVGWRQNWHASFAGHPDHVRQLHSMLLLRSDLLASYKACLWFLLLYCIAGKFGGGKVWWIDSFRTFSKRKFDELIDQPIDI